MSVHFFFLGGGAVRAWELEGTVESHPKGSENGRKMERRMGKGKDEKWEDKCTSCHHFVHSCHASLAPT